MKRLASGMLVMGLVWALAGAGRAVTPVNLGITVPGPAMKTNSWSTLVATDASGGVYACDGDTIWRLDAAGGAFSAVFAGVGSAADADVDPSGFAVNAAGTTAYVATGVSGRIVAVDLAGGSARELSGARAGASNYGLAVDPIHGQLFATDSYTQELWRVDPAGQGSLTSLDTFGWTGWFGSGIGFAPDGTLVVPVATGFSDWENDKDDYPTDVYRFTREWLDAVAAGSVPVGAGQKYATGVQVSGSGVVAVDKSGRAYLLAADAIYQVKTGGAVGVFVGDASLNAFSLWGCGYSGMTYDLVGDRLLFVYRASAGQDWGLYEVALPEPATALLLLGGTAGAMVVRRRRR